MRRVCSKTSPSGWNCGGCCTPFRASTSGRMTLSRPLASSEVPAADTLRREKNPHQLFRTRSALMVAMLAAAPTMAFQVAGSISNSSTGRETDRTQQAEPVLGKTLARVANRPDDACGKILAAADKVDYLVVRRIEEHPVDGEVAPARVFFRRRKMDLGRMASVDISPIGTKGRDLELEIIFEDNNHPKMGADRIGSAKDLLHFLGARISRDIDVFWHLAPDKIADATASPVSDMPCCPQSLNYRTRGREHRRFLTGTRSAIHGSNARLSRRGCRGGTLFRRNRCLTPTHEDVEELNRCGAAAVEHSDPTVVVVESWCRWS